MKVIVLVLLAVSQISANTYTQRYSKQYSASSSSTVSWTSSFNFAGDLRTGLRVAADESKPIMLIIHRAYCGACKKLLPQLGNSDEVKELSKNFVVVHSDGEMNDDLAEKQGPQYFPRIIFFSSNANPLKQACSNSRDYPFYFETAAAVAKAMRTALQQKNY